MIHINDLFWTFQGEGVHAGRRALFIRMPFCNLACSWCDTTFDKFKPWTEDDLIEAMKSEPGTFAVITGGEPTMHKHTPRVIELLKQCGFQIAVESNGTKPIPERIDFVTVSPKRFSGEKGMPEYFIHDDAMAKASEFKYVVDRYFDFSTLLKHDVTDGRRYSLSPEFGEFTENLNKIFDYIKEHPEWRISLQTHKWMAIP